MLMPLASFCVQRALEQRDLDGELGIVWGGRERCAPEDDACRNNGQVSRPPMQLSVFA
jgi:hypothetical protein